MKKIIFWLFLLGIIFPVSGQTQQVVKLENVLKVLEDKYHISFSYPTDLLKDKEVVMPDFKESLDDILLSIGLQTDIEFNRIDKQYIFLSNIKRNMLNKVIITGYITKGIYKNNDGSFGFRPKNLGLLPGLTDNDILASLQFLPGVISPDESLGNLIIHGGNTDENGILWDGMKIYHSGHLFGTISPFNPYVTQEVNFIYKATDVEYHDFASGIIDIRTLNKITNRFRIDAGLNGLSADIVMDIPVIHNKMSIQTSFRRSYEDLLETKTFSKYEEQAFQNTKIRDEKFHFKDYHFKLNYAPNKKHYLGISTLHIDNDLENQMEDNHHNTIYDFLDTENDGISLNWKYKISENIAWKNTFAYSKYYFINRYKTRYATNEVSEFTKENFIKNGSFKSVFSQNKKNKFWKIGWETDYKHLLYNFKEKNGLSFTLDKDDSRLITHALFGMYQLKLKKWDISTGIRLNYYTELNKFVPEPRIRINRLLSDKLHLQISAEHKHQPVTQIRQTVLSDFYAQQKVWRLADEKKYPVLSSYQYTAGLLYHQNHFNFDIDFYYKHTRGITSYSLGFLNPDDPQLHQGQQKAYGIDVFGKRKWKNFSLQASYAYMLAQRQFEGINQEKWFVSDNQIQHSFSLLAAYQYKNFDITAAWKIRSGLPYTELEIEEDFDNDIDEDFYEFDGINTEQLPIFYRLDVSARYRFNLSSKHKIKGSLALSLKNITHNRTQTGIFYTGNNSLNDSIRIIKYYSVGIIPNFSFRIKF